MLGARAAAIAAVPRWCRALRSSAALGGSRNLVWKMLRKKKKKFWYDSPTLGSKLMYKPTTLDSVMKVDQIKTRKEDNIRFRVLNGLIHKAMAEMIAIYVGDRLQSMELCLGTGEQSTESLWVRVKGRTVMGDIIVGICYRPPDQGDSVDEALYRQIGAASCSQALVLMGDFNHPDICWRDGTAWHKQSRRFLDYVEDNFLLQVIEEPTRRGAMLDLVLTNREGLVGNLKLQGSLDCSDHEMVEFEILRTVRRACSKLTALDFKRADFGLFRNLLSKVPWDTALEGRGAQDCWLIFKDDLLQAQERCIPTRRKFSRRARRPPWMDKELLSKI
uniref:Endonuclease/exonuclease/phosphatase domain-containing protein n=1 Tax=Amazona collaria TaxID=241587 RepID=A0A8B9ISU6_9PSIT